MIITHRSEIVNNFFTTVSIEKPLNDLQRLSFVPDVFGLVDRPDSACSEAVLN
jgi:hypothetical protein